MTPEEVKQDTQAHIDRVGDFLGRISAFIGLRAEGHDASKLLPPEVEMFCDVTEKLNGLTYGSPEYEAQRQTMLGIALKHHYEHNRHHPEHYPFGIDGMTLIDLVEMFCDWLAATERHADGDIFKSIQFNAGRFGIAPQLVCLLENTAELFRERPTRDTDRKQEKLQG